MADDTDRQMTIPELLEAREKIRSQLDQLATGARRSNFSSQNKAELAAILEEIEAELAELGYTGAADSHDVSGKES